MNPRITLKVYPLTPVVQITVEGIDRFAYEQAVNANAITSAAGGVDSMIAYTLAQAPSPGSNVARALAAASVYPGGLYETSVVTPWLIAAKSSGGCGVAGPPATDAADLLATLRTAAATQLPA